jgi:hypothetical protein
MRIVTFSALTFLFAAVSPVPADTTINVTNRYAHGANVGWVNARGDITDGAVIGRAYCSGYMYGGNVGWICLGAGSPDNGYAYSNLSATDYGVNHDGIGNLRGYAYGANIGWINFETNGAARVDLSTGALSGYAYGANIGWISLSNVHAYVQTDTLDPGPDADGDGIPDAWEYAQVGNTSTLTASGDHDDDGVPDVDEYGSDTDPDDAGASLRITAMVQTPAGKDAVAWTVEPTRHYRLERATALSSAAAWSDSGLGVMPPGSAATMAREVTSPVADKQVYRAKAVVPLAP